MLMSYWCCSRKILPASSKLVRFAIWVTASPWECPGHPWEWRLHFEELNHCKDEFVPCIGAEQRLDLRMSPGLLSSFHLVLSSTTERYQPNMCLRHVAFPRRQINSAFFHMTIWNSLFPCNDPHVSATWCLEPFENICCLPFVSKLFIYFSGRSTYLEFFANTIWILTC